MKKSASTVARIGILTWILSGMVVAGMCYSPGRESLAQETPKAAAHWAFRPVTAPPPPQIKGSTRTTVDRFILARLETKGQSLNPEADRLTLLRRVAFDLTGLPPSLAEMDAFLADKAPDAYEKMVNRYLASPHYGERWGKYWLDAAGYADSNGYFNADSDRPLAWRYRDWVIRAFNADKPYDRFVFEQLAGDELAGFEPGGDVTPETAELLTATHFLRNAPDGTGESDGNPDEVRIDRYTVLEGNLQNMMNCLLGLTIQCARCHKHKFEPISHREYYSLQAFLFPVYNADRWKPPNQRVVEVGTKAERTERQRQTEAIDKDIKALQAELNSAAEPLRKRLLEERLKDLDVAVRAKVLTAVQAAKGKLTAEQQTLLKTHAKAVTISDDDLAKRFPDFAAQRDKARTKIVEREKDRPRPADKLAAFFETDPNPAMHHLLRRGQHNQPGEEVDPGVLAIVSTPKNTFQAPAKPKERISTGRRTAFARWVTSAENPLFARVMVNRIWQHHFGTGLVTTPDNLGQSGAKPSNPELLDHLAAEFVRGGWSIKALHRLILGSAVYRQASTPRPDLAKVDPDNQLLGRFPLLRLDAEALRDALLSVAGDLDANIGGPYVPTRRTTEGIVEVAANQNGTRRRAVYMQQRRTQVDTFQQLFDAPAIVSTCSVRQASTMPLQALALLNGDFTRARAKAFAGRLGREAGIDLEMRLTQSFRLACGRPPTADEMEASKRFLATQKASYAGRADADERTWIDLGQTILISNAFLYVE